MADVIARVVVTSVERPQEVRSSADPVTYTALASAVWKGEVASAYVFVSALEGASCGLEGIEEGAEIVLFATSHGDGINEPADGQYASNLCSGTGPATEELVAELTGLLGDPQEPVGAETVPDVPGSETGWFLPAGIAVLAGFGVIAVYIRRYRRDHAPEPLDEDPDG